MQEFFRKFFTLFYEAKSSVFNAFRAYASHTVFGVSKICVFRFFAFLIFFLYIVEKNNSAHYIWSLPLLYCVKLVSQNLIYQDYMYPVIDP